MRDGVAVAQVTLDHLAQVRILVPQPENRALSSSGLGHHPLKVETRVRVPLGLPEKSRLPGLEAFSYSQFYCNFTAIGLKLF